MNYIINVIFQEYRLDKAETYLRWTVDIESWWRE